jgi:cell division protein ZapA (FtsZ GTPase activity inhibitor)
MIKQKQSRAEQHEKKIQALINVVYELKEGQAFLKELAVGTMETIKYMDDYPEALKKLKENLLKEESEDKKLEL